MSIQTILAHLIKAGYNYAIAIRKYLGENLQYMEVVQLKTVGLYQEELKQMFAYNEQLFADYPTIVLEEQNPQKKVLVSWGQRYDVEQLMEHAIVHILRHRRQIERFLIKMSKDLSSFKKHLSEMLFFRYFPPKNSSIEQLFNDFLKKTSEKIAIPYKHFLKKDKSKIKITN